MEHIYEPWPWYVSGFLIALTMLVLILLGKKFGMSSNLKTLCAIGGANKYSAFFKYHWRDDVWNLIVVLGAILGGFIAAHYLSYENDMPQLSESTLASLEQIGIASENSYLPVELFSLEALNFKTVFILVVGGFLVGFGARYAGGCTSGHAISGLSNFQRPSLIAVIGFFIGGLIMVHIIYPLIF
ncbi:MAG: YeeE/YedE family protein [Algicola sp.]|nr:YeeE/YedE family protein [Algicola sp.]